MSRIKVQQRFLITSFILLATVVPFYKIKSRLGINLAPGAHTPSLVEEITGGVVKARWIDRNYLRRPDSWKVD